MTISTSCHMLACRTCTDPACDHACHVEYRRLTTAHQPATVRIPTPPLPSRVGEEVLGQPAFDLSTGHEPPAPQPNGAGVNGAIERARRRVAQHPRSKTAGPVAPGPAGDRKDGSTLPATANPIVQAAS